jgi:hypothetical protein
MISFSAFLPIFCKNIGAFLENQYYDPFLAKTAIF